MLVFQISANSTIVLRHVLSLLHVHGAGGGNGTFAKWRPLRLRINQVPSRCSENQGQAPYAQLEKPQGRRTGNYQERNGSLSGVEQVVIRCQTGRNRSMKFSDAFVVAVCPREALAMVARAARRGSSGRATAPQTP